jgi:FG-GAP-like repeat
VYPTVSGLQSVIVADFNGDQRLDLAVGGTSSSGFGSGVSVLLNNGDGTFQAALNNVQGDCPVAIPQQH